MHSDQAVPSHEDPVVAELTGGIGGPVGRHARIGSSGFWTPLRVMLALTMLTVLGGWALKAPCRTHAWADQYQYTRMCYSDVFALYYGEGLNEGKVPYADHPVEYPVVIGGVMWLVAEVADTSVEFFDFTTLLLLACAMVTVAASARTAGRRRPWDAALIALAPGVVLHATTNWDLVAVAFAALGMWAWARRMPVVAGIWWGLGVSAKLYPLLFFGPLFVLCWRAGRLREWRHALLGGAAAAVAVNLPIALAYPESWSRFFELNRERGADWDSLHYLVQEVARRAGAPNFGWDRSVLNVVVAVTFLGACLLLAWLIAVAPRRPRVAQVFFLVVALFLLSNKVNSPQYTLWLVPLAALARPRWGAFLTWQFTELLVLFTRYYFFVNLGSPPDGLPVNWFLAAIVVRDAALIWLMWRVVREIWHPDEDVVRADGTDDPAGGPLDGAPDRVERLYADTPAYAG